MGNRRTDALWLGLIGLASLVGLLGTRFLGNEDRAGPVSTDFSVPRLDLELPDIELHFPLPPRFEAPDMPRLDLSGHARTERVIAEVRTMLLDSSVPRETGDTRDAGASEQRVAARP